MDQLTIYPGADTAPLRYAAAFLQEHGCQITNTPSKAVTHLLLPVPSFDSNGYIKGSSIDPRSLLQPLPWNICVIGGNLKALSLPQEQVLDLLKDEEYQAQNAAITAHCALKVASRHMDRTFQALPVLVIGWGRIGKCLARLLRALDAQVTVAARKETDRAMLRTLGYRTCSISQLSSEASRFDFVFNTVPYPILDAANCHASSVLLELASSPGITGAGVIDARGLPGKEAPRTSGDLIGKTILRLAGRKEHIT